MTGKRRFAGLVIGLVVSSTAWSAAKADIPISIAAPATVNVSVNGIPRTPISGTLPLTLPYNIGGPDCSSIGSVEASLVNGRLRLRVSGSLSVGPAGGCSVDASVEFDGFELDVPDLGESTTPVLFNLEHTAGQFAGPRSPASSFSVTASPASSLIGGRLHLCAASICRVALDVNSEGPRRDAALTHMIPGDSMTFETSPPVLPIHLPNLSGGDTFDETVEFYLATPPDLQQASIPPQVGWLVGGLLIGIGVKLSRRKTSA